MGVALLELPNDRIDEVQVLDRERVGDGTGSCNGRRLSWSATPQSRARPDGDVVVVAAVAGVVVVTEDVVVLFGVVGLLLLLHAATTVANAKSSNPALRRVTMIMPRNYVRVPGQGRADRP